MIEKYEFKRSSFLKFAFKYGIRNVARETARIFLRSVKELSPNYIICAFDEYEKIVGYGTLRKIPARYKFAFHNSGIIGSYFVEKCYRGSEIGSNILFELEQIAREKGFQKIYAYVLRQNIGSKRTFEKLGYTMIGYMINRSDGFYLADDGDFCIYCKEL